MQVEPHISKNDNLARHVDSLPRLPAGGRFDLDTCAGLALPVQPNDQDRVDEKYSALGYNSIDARMGADWNQQDERVG